MGKCKYEGCEYEVNSPHDEEWCLFHAPSEKKGVGKEDYNTKLNKHITRNRYDFIGYIFPWKFGFGDSHRIISINEKVNFKDCTFEGNEESLVKTEIGDLNLNLSVDFRNIKFLRGVNFSNAKFKNVANFTSINSTGGDTDFRNTTFFDNAYFDKSEFLNSTVIFNNAKFLGNLCSFMDCNFKGNDIKILEKKIVSFNNCSFKNARFSKSHFNIKLIDFDFSTFQGNFADFDNLNIECDTLSFRETKFDVQNLNFIRSYLKGNTIIFIKVLFNCKTSFDETEFQILDNKSSVYNTFQESDFKNETSFVKTIFNCGKLSFKQAHFNDKTRFTSTEFYEGVNFENTEFKYSFDEHSGEKNKNANVLTKISVEFLNAKFKGNNSSFSNSSLENFSILFKDTIIDGDIKFEKINFHSHSILKFENIYFNTNSSFIFRSPAFHDTKVSTISLSFYNIVFPEHKTFFEGIRPILSGLNPLPNVIIGFRKCILVNVYFTDNQMSAFSLYQSLFDRAIFTLNSWYSKKRKLIGIFEFNRRNILFEDLIMYQFYKKANSNYYSKDVKSKMFILINLRSTLKLDFMNYTEIASMYRKMKVALDVSKDYQQAGWFYFNEFEMSRLALKYEKGFWKYVSYSLYKVISGYGEKPFWSFLWFWFFTFLFSIINLLLIGFKYKDEFIKYNFDFYAIPNFITFFWIKDFYTSILFTISRVIPSYFPFDKTDFTSIGLLGTTFNILTALVLLFLIIMTGVGVKRHFRRF